MYGTAEITVRAGVQKMKPKSNDALRQEEVRREAAVKKMYRLRALRQGSKMAGYGAHKLVAL